MLYLCFFLLSGYFAIRSIEQTNPVEYAIKRFFKLYPVYWVAILITIPLVVTFLPSRAVSIKDMLLNFTMLQTILGADHVDGAYWTLFCELVFYVLVFLVCVLKKQKYVDKLILLWTLFQVLLLIIPNVSVFIEVKKLNTLIYGHCFMAGASIACLEQKLGINKPVSYKEKITIILLVVSIAFFIGQQFLQHELASGIFLIFATAIVSLAIFAYKSNKLPRRGIVLFKPLVFLAMISYPLYLLHQNIGYIIIRALDSIGLSNECFLIVPIGVIIALAYFLHQFVEKPVSKLSSTLCKRLNDNFFIKL